MTSIRPSSAVSISQCGRRRQPQWVSCECAIALPEEEHCRESATPPPSLRETRASRLAACHGEPRVNYGLAIEPKDEQAESSLTRLHLVWCLVNKIADSRV